MGYEHYVNTYNSSGRAGDQPSYQLFLKCHFYFRFYTTYAQNNIVMCSIRSYYYYMYTIVL